MKSPGMRKTALAAVVAAVCMVSPARGEVLFSDDFDVDAASSVLNFTSFLNWTVTQGSVDYIRSGDYGITCAGGAGGCVDMDGSSLGAAGRIESNTIFDFETGSKYILTLEYSGNQRDPTPDQIAFGITGLDRFALYDVEPLDPFVSRSISYTFESPHTGRIFVGDPNPSADFFGVILDNVALRLPEPGTLGLLGLVLAGIVIGGRKEAAGPGKREGPGRSGGLA
jgi:hypothetical protein